MSFILKKIFYYIWNIPYFLFLLKRPRSISTYKSNNQTLLNIVAFNKPESLSLQIKLFKKYVYKKYDLLICDNSSNQNASNQIFNICTKNEINYIRLPNNPYTNIANGSYSHGAAMNYIYRNFILNSNYTYFGFIDHDIFPIAKLNINKNISYYNFLGLKQERKKERVYLWPGYCFFNKKYCSNLKLDFRPTTGVDTGGRLCKYFTKINNKVKFVKHEYSDSSELELRKNQGYEIIDNNWIHCTHIKNYDIKANLNYIHTMIQNKFLN